MTAVVAPAPASRARAALVLLRVPNALIAAVGVVVGAWWARPGSAFDARVGLAALAAFAVAGAVNAFNDIFDVDIDRRAHPERPLPSGAMGTRAAAMLACAATAAALLIARRLDAASQGLVLGALVVGYAYSPALKAHGLLGNLSVAVVGSFPFLVGADAVGDAADALVLFAVAVPLHLAREIVKDIADTTGDEGRRRTLPIVGGTALSRAVATAAVVLHAGLASFLFAPAGWRLLALLPAVALAAWATARADATRGATLLKVAMLLAMAALFVLR